MDSLRTTIDRGGRVVIPAEFRRELGLRPGDNVLVSCEHGAVRIETYSERIKRAQALVAKYIPAGGPSLSDELIAERRAEAARDG